MPGLRFETAGAEGVGSPDRVDVACFVGFVARRPGARPAPGDEPGFTPLPPSLLEWLRAEGWAARAGAARVHRHTRGDDAVRALLDVPVPLDSWEAFDHLFAWDQRPFPGGRTGGTYLGAAVRSFFAEGGRRCFVVRVGDPWPFAAPPAERRAGLAALLPGGPEGLAPSAADRASWRGVGHLLGLPEVSFLCLPDLPDAAAGAPLPLAPVPPFPVPPERFVECAPEVPVPRDRRLVPVRAPRSDRDGYAVWADAVRQVAEFVRSSVREVQLIASPPLPGDGVALPGGGRAADELLRFLTDEGWLRGTLASQPGSLASAFVQLAYPWVRTSGSGLLPEGVEPPDGALAGMLARNALLRGTFRSAGSLSPGDLWGVFPVVGRDQLEGLHHAPSGDAGPDRTLLQRVSLFGPTPRGIRLLSDVTTARDESWRPAGVGRLVAAVVRAARRVGEALAFEASGPALWRQVEESLAQLLAAVAAEGALRVARGEPGYEVRCDRTTMTAADLDAGRVVAVVNLAPAAALESIVVVLAMEEGGGVRVLESAPALAVAA